MTEVTLEDGSKMETNLPAEAVADLNATTEPEAKESEPSQKSEEPAKAEPEAKTEEPAKQEPEVKPEPQKREKPKPIANLLSKLHEEREAREAAERRAAEAEAKLGKPADAPAAEPTDKAKALAEKYGLEEQFVQDLLSSLTPQQQSQLPKEVQELLAERQAEKQQRAELAEATTRIEKLAKAFPNEPIAQHKDKLLELAYSDQAAPDGEPFYKKELAELYFGYIKPETEPGTVSAEERQPGNGVKATVVDFEQIYSDPAKLEEFATNATSEEFAKFQAWSREKHGKEPLIKSSI